MFKPPEDNIRGAHFDGNRKTIHFRAQKSVSISVTAESLQSSSFDTTFSKMVCPTSWEESDCSLLFSGKGQMVALHTG